MKTIFKKGDKVFCLHLGGWGEVIKEENAEHTPFTTRCSFSMGKASFTWDGRFYEEAPPTLSFTEYTLEGFSQERPEELPEIGQVVWVRENRTTDWRVSHFFGKQGDKYLASIFGIKEMASTWPEMTTKNPHENKES
jgi:hypothetical protein